MARHVEVSAANMRAIANARADHDARCSGNAVEVHLAPFDVERMQWEDGDVVVGLVVVSDAAVQPGILTIVCDEDLGTKVAAEATHAVSEPVPA